MRLYDYLPSGNGYKVRLLLRQLRLPFELIEVDILAGASRTPEFLGKNPNGRIPVLEVHAGVFLAESNAILSYLADDTPFLPRDRLEQKRTLGYAALGVMEGHLASREFFVGDRYSIADIALYAYTHVADEGGFDLSRFPAVLGWLERVRRQPGHVPITQKD